MIYICEASEVGFFGEAEEDRHRFKYVVIFEAFVCVMWDWLFNTLPRATKFDYMGF